MPRIRYLALLLFLSAFQSYLLQAQKPVWSMAVGSSGLGTGYVSDLAVDRQGASYITGTFSGFCTFDTVTLSCLTGTDIFLAKYDAAGAIVWAKKIGGTGSTEEAPYLAVDTAGHLWITGAYSGTIQFPGHPLISTGARDIFLAGYDVTGNLLQAASYGSTYDDQPFDITADADGNLYTTGMYARGNTAMHDTISFGGYNLISPGDAAMYLVKLDGEGRVVWAESAGTVRQNSGLVAGEGLALDGAGNIYVVGIFDNKVTFDSVILTAPISSGTCMFLVKYDATGKALWARQATGNSWTCNIYPAAVAVDASGFAYVTGDYQGFSGGGYGGAPTPAFLFGNTQLTGSSGSFLAGYEPGGNPAWAKNTGGHCVSMTGNSLVADPSGDVYLAGGGSGFIANGDTLPCYHSILVARYDQSGTARWAVGAGNDKGGGAVTGLARTPGGDLVAVGSYRGWCDFGAYSLLNNGPNSELFLARLSPATTGVPEWAERAPLFTLSPNPSSGSVALHLNGTAAGKVRVVDALGRTVYTRGIPAGTRMESLQLEWLPEGCYYVQVQTAEERGTVKLVVAH